MYRKSHAYRIALITAACQRANMRYRVAPLESGRAVSVSTMVRSRDGYSTTLWTAAARVR